MAIERSSTSEWREKSCRVTFRRQAKLYPVRVHFFDRNGTFSQATQPHSLLHMGLVTGAPASVGNIQNLEPGRQERAPARCAGAQYFDLVDRIPDQEEATFAAEADRPTKVGAELTFPQAGCCE
jgi:hypothetical protein